MSKPKTGGRIHSSDIHRIGNVTGIKPEEWDGPSNKTPPASKEDCTSRRFDAKCAFKVEDAYSFYC